MKEQQEWGQTSISEKQLKRKKNNNIALWHLHEILKEFCFRGNVQSGFETGVSHWFGVTHMWPSWKPTKAQVKLHAWAALGSYIQVRWRESWINLGVDPKHPLHYLHTKDWVKWTRTQCDMGQRVMHTYALTGSVSVISSKIPLTVPPSCLRTCQAWQSHCEATEGNEVRWKATEHVACHEGESVWSMKRREWTERNEEKSGANMERGRQGHRSHVCLQGLNISLLRGQLQTQSGGFSAAPLVSTTPLFFSYHSLPGFLVLRPIVAGSKLEVRSSLSFIMR